MHVGQVGANMAHLSRQVTAQESVAEHGLWFATLASDKVSKRQRRRVAQQARYERMAHNRRCIRLLSAIVVLVGFLAQTGVI